MWNNKHTLGLLAIGALAALSIPVASAQPAATAQAYPIKPIRMIVGVAPGGATDILARAVGARLSEAFKQQVIVENRPGANHIIGGELTAKSPKDGYTIQMIPEGFVINASVYTKLPFDPVKDFSPIAIVANVPNVLVVHPSLPARTVKQFAAIARARPGQLSYGSSSVGSPSHMSGEMFKVFAKVDYVHVPYKGQSLALVDLMGGHIQFLFPSIPSAVQHVRSGKLVALGEYAVLDPDQIERLLGSKRNTRGSLTSVRSMGRTAATFSRTSSAALRPLMCNWNSMVTIEVPSRLREVSALMPAMLLTLSSIFLLTSDSTISGEAPG